MVAHNLMLMTAALVLDGLIGDPAWLYRRLPHPVVWIGKMLAMLDRCFNRDSHGAAVRIMAGGLGLALVLAVFGCGAWALDHALSTSLAGDLVLALLSSTLLAQRSLYDHVRAVATPLVASDIERARIALGRIVGRDVEALDSAGISGAAIESLAENLSDGVVAPLFWGCVLGFPGLVLYKAINTADSMLGHRSPRHLHFGRVAARLDDLVNWLPARLTAILIAAVSWSARAFRVMRADAGQHRSPNAGWPEAAMAGALNVRLSGPRIYHGVPADEPWINPSGGIPASGDIRRALGIMILICLALLALTGALYFKVSGSPATTSSTWLAAAATS